MFFCRGGKTLGQSSQSVWRDVRNEHFARGRRFAPQTKPLQLLQKYEEKCNRSRQVCVYMANDDLYRPTRKMTKRRWACFWVFMHAISYAEHTMSYARFKFEITKRNFSWKFSRMFQGGEPGREKEQKAGQNVLEPKWRQTHIHVVYATDTKWTSNSTLPPNNSYPEMFTIKLWLPTTLRFVLVHNLR